MNRFTRSSIALAALTLAGVFSFSNQANADTAQVEIETTVATSCAFDAASLTDGTLGQNSTTNTLNSTDTANGGASASIDLTCNNAGSTLAIGTVVFTQPTAAIPNLTSRLVTVTHPNGITTNNGTTTTAAVPITTIGSAQTVTIEAQAIYNTTLIAGEYNFTIDLTANP